MALNPVTELEAIVEIWPTWQSSKAPMTMKDSPIEMSPRAIARRLEEIRALCDLMRYLARFRPLVEAAEAHASTTGRRNR